MRYYSICDLIRHIEALSFVDPTNVILSSTDIKFNEFDDDNENVVVAGENVN